MKKRIFISNLTALILLLSASVTIHANAILGDINQNSVLDANDAYAILEHSANIGAGNGGTLSDKALMSADFSTDGKINAKDAFKILVHIAESERLIAEKSKELVTILDELATIDKWKAEWKKAYSIQLTKYQSYQNSYELADINGDSIPELFIMLFSENTENIEDVPKTIVYTYQNGSCQQIYFPTESGAIDSYKMYVSSEFDGLFVRDWNSSSYITSITSYKIDNFTAIPQHTLTKDYANGICYFNDTSITIEEYDNYLESAYWFSQFCDTINRDLLNSYGTGEVQANFIEDSITLDMRQNMKNWLEFKVTCNNITEKSNITFHVVPHGSEHVSENTIEEFYITNLYAAVHNGCKGFCAFGETPVGDYDLFMLDDDGTELDSITFEVK